MDKKIKITLFSILPLLILAGVYFWISGYPCLDDRATWFFNRQYISKNSGDLFNYVVASSSSCRKTTHEVKKNNSFQKVNQRAFDDFLQQYNTDCNNCLVYVSRASGRNQAYFDYMTKVPIPPPPPIATPPGATPVIFSVSPTAAPPRTEVTITGSGFTQTGNTVHFGTEIIPDITSADGKTLVFTLPSGCRGGSPCAPGTYTTVLPGSYRISVANEKGTSNSVVFTVIKAEDCTPRCTADIREMCSPDGKEKKTVPSDCSCGEDAETLIAKGWKDCAKNTQSGQPFSGTVKTGAQLGEVKSYCPNGLYLVADEGTYLVEQTTILQLRVPGNVLLSDQKYINQKVSVIGKYPAQEFFCEALICGCDDYILVERIEIVDGGNEY